MTDVISFLLNDKPVQIKDLAPTTTLLEYLRDHIAQTGTKEGCAEGDCGACTVAILDRRGPDATWRSINSCLVLLPMLHGKEVYTVEGIAAKDQLHPVQQAIVRKLGSQCGYCTPGVVMTLFEACYRQDMDAPWKMDDQLCGTLCRCTGYRPIREAAEEIRGLRPDDTPLSRTKEQPQALESLDYEVPNHRFLRPTNLMELWRAVANHPEHTFIAGATDLGLSITKHYKTWPVLIGLDAVSELTELTFSDESWSIGAAVRLSDLESYTDQRLVPLARMLRFFGSRQIKNRATVGGSLCNASPIGDLAPILFALDANIVIGSASGERTVPITDFFLDYRKTALQQGEVLLRVTFPHPPATVRMSAYKVSKRRELDISAVSAGMRVILDGDVVSDICLAYGGMAATTKRADQTEAALLNKTWDEANVRKAMALVAKDFSPFTDHRGTSWYRTRVAQNLLLGFFLETQKVPQPRLPDRCSGTVLVGGQS